MNEQSTVFYDINEHNIYNLYMHGHLNDDVKIHDLDSFEPIINALTAIFHHNELTHIKLWFPVANNTDAKLNRYPHHKTLTAQLPKTDEYDKRELIIELDKCINVTLRQYSLSHQWESMTDQTPQSVSTNSMAIAQTILNVLNQPNHQEHPDKDDRYKQINDSLNQLSKSMSKTMGKTVRDYFNIIASLTKKDKTTPYLKATLPKKDPPSDNKNNPKN